MSAANRGVSPRTLITRLAAAFPWARRGARLDEGGGDSDETSLGGVAAQPTDENLGEGDRNQGDIGDDESDNRTATPTLSQLPTPQAGVLTPGFGATTSRDELLYSTSEAQEGVSSINQWASGSAPAAPSPTESQRESQMSAPSATAASPTTAGGEPKPKREVQPGRVLRPLQHGDRSPIGSDDMTTTSDGSSPLLPPPPGTVYTQGMGTPPDWREDEKPVSESEQEKENGDIKNDKTDSQDPTGHVPKAKAQGTMPTTLPLMPSPLPSAPSLASLGCPAPTQAHQALQQHPLKFARVKPSVKPPPTPAQIQQHQQNLKAGHRPFKAAPPGLPGLRPMAASPPGFKFKAPPPSYKLARAPGAATMSSCQQEAATEKKFVHRQPPPVYVEEQEPEPAQPQGGMPGDSHQEPAQQPQQGFDGEGMQARPGESHQEQQGSLSPE